MNLLMIGADMEVYYQLKIVFQNEQHKYSTLFECNLICGREFY